MKKNEIFKDERIKEKFYIIEGRDINGENQRIDLFNKSSKETKKFAEGLNLKYKRIWEALITRYETIEVKKLIK
jgi:hypothetical protein